MTLSIHDVGFFFLMQDEKPMPAMKLHKLVYYAQIFGVVGLGKPIFAEEMKSWAYGPVAPALYDTHRKSFLITLDHLKPYVDVDELQEKLANMIEEKNVLMDVWETYGHLPGFVLSELIRVEGPWKIARDEQSGMPKTRVISVESIREHCKKIKMLTT